MIKDRPLLGISLMLGFCILAPLGDSIAKLLGDKVPLGVLLLTRFALQAILLLPLGIFFAHPLKMSRQVFVLTMARTVLHIMGIGAMVMSLRYLPLADAVAIAFIMPLIMLLLGKTILNENVGPHRLAACAVGFLGTLLVIQPNFTDVGAPALLPLFVALDFALFMLVTRQIAKQIDPISLQFISGILACFLLVPALILSPSGWAEMQVIMPARNHLAQLFLLGTIGTIAHLFLTWSLRYAPSATLAPIQYMEIPFATALGWLIFRDFPNGLAAIGILITIAAGLYIIHRERIIARQIGLQPQTTPTVAE